MSSIEVIESMLMDEELTEAEKLELLEWMVEVENTCQREIHPYSVQHTQAPIEGGQNPRKEMIYV
jgi:hypothetical protein